MLSVSKSLRRCRHFKPWHFAISASRRIPPSVVKVAVDHLSVLKGLETLQLHRASTFRWIHWFSGFQRLQRGSVTSLLAPNFNRPGNDEHLISYKLFNTCIYYIYVYINIYIYIINTCIYLQEHAANSPRYKYQGICLSLANAESHKNIFNNGKT